MAISRRTRARARRIDSFMRNRRLRLEALEERRLLAASGLWLNPDPTLSDGILVQLRDSASGNASFQAAPDVSFLTPGLKRIALDSGDDIATRLDALRRDENILFAEPDYAVSIQVQPNDPSFGSLWGLHNVGQTGGTIDADMDVVEAWDVTVGSGQTIVAVIDTGVDYTHEDLAANMWVNGDEIPGDGIDNDGNGYVDDIYGYDFANNDPDPMDDHNHGTHVAGTIGAVGDNGIGLTGVNWNVQIMALKFLRANGNGNISAAISALEYAVDNGAAISSNSWGFNGGESQALSLAVAQAQQAGHIFVAAAGNGNFAGVGLNNDATPFWPSNVDTDNVVAVAALDHNDAIAPFSNFGARTVDVGAPGVNVLSTTIGNTYSTFSGTSMATPHVSGAIAMLVDLYPEWGYERVIDRLFATVDPVSDLAGVTATGGRVNAASLLAPDVVAPTILDVAPAGAVSSTTDRMQVTFSETIDGVTFDASDIVSFTGPDGNVPVLNVQPVANSLGRAYEVVFQQQTTLGDYTMVVGSNIADYAGNLLDQNQDGSGGNADDQVSHTFTILPFVGKYDFGSANSALAAGYTRVHPASSYDAAAGYGWIGGGGIAVSRGGGDDLTHDLVYAPDLTFETDVPDGVYNVTLTIGDLGPYDHELMEVRLEGLVADTVSTLAGEVLSLEFTDVAVNDDRLTLELIDRGGGDANVVLNGLDVVWQGPDNTGPKVILTEPAGPDGISLDRLKVTFSKPLAAGSFDVNDVLALSGPGGPIAVTGVVPVSATEYDVLFDPQTALGNYELTIGADIEDENGNLFDQDGDGVGGENPDDHFIAQFALEPFSQAFDFGRAESPVASDHLQVTAQTSYSSSTGFGWLGGLGTAVDRASGDDLTRDLVYGSDLTFATDVPDGAYDATLTLGDLGPFVHDQIAVTFEGIAFETVTTPSGQILVRSYSNITVSDGQLTLQLSDGGGVDPNVVINGLQLTRTGPDQAGPQIIATSPSRATTGVLDHVLVTFNESIDELTFTAADVASVVGPSGAVAVTGVSRIADSEYRIDIEPQNEIGVYQFSIGPDIADAAGNLMNQDGDGVNGEAADDQFLLDVVLSAFVEKYDFGSAASAVAADHVQVTPNLYSSSAGFGYLTPNVLAISRAGGTALTKDLHYASTMTFAVDVPEGMYDVTLTAGDTDPYVHDLVSVQVEGAEVDVISTAAGEVQTFTYEAISVSDGQLTLTLEDTGGSDVNAVLNGLTLTWVGEDASAPRVQQMALTGELLDPVDSVILTFSRAMDASTFTAVDDLVLLGPSGPIVIDSIVQLSDTEFEVRFQPQTESGDYSLEVGPDIRDSQGRPLDQDGDGIHGEPDDDVFIGAFTIPPPASRFDFGPAWTPVAAGYTQVTHNNGYSSAAGFGWQGGTVQTIDRGGGDAVSRDLAYGAQLDFAADVTSGAYDVTITLGDLGPYLHDNIEIYVEGLRLETVSTAPQEILAITFEGISIADGQFNLTLVDTGGADANAVINGLEIVSSQAAATPRVVRAEAINDGAGVERVRVVFNEAMDPATFTVADVVSLTDPLGNAIAIDAVTAVSVNEFDLLFQPQSAVGDYQLVLGADIASDSGVLLDQDGDGVGGEDPDDRFESTVSVPPISAKYDFGLAFSPVEPGFVKVTPNQPYTAVAGYGYLSSGVAGIDRWVGTALMRDIHYASDLTFAADVPDGAYQVTLHIGDMGPYAHEQIAVYLAGSQVDTVSTAAGAVNAFTYNDVNVTGGQLEIRLVDVGGPDVNVVLAGVEIDSQVSGASMMSLISEQDNNAATPRDATKLWRTAKDETSARPRRSYHALPGIDVRDRVFESYDDARFRTPDLAGARTRAESIESRFEDADRFADSAEQRELRDIAVWKLGRAWRTTF